MKYFSSFSGIGGFELGIQQAYEDKSNKEHRKRTRGTQCSQSQGNKSSTESFLGEECRIKCVGYSEIDKYAIQIYQKHFPKHKNYGNITKIIASKVPDHDLFIGGFPCQSFSIAGKRGGFKDTRGTLFFDIARIIKAKRPKNILLENVKGLLSHDKGNTFATIISTIDELGYDCQWNVLNSKNFGVPQNRERVFIIGHLRGTSRPKVFPIQQSSQGNLKYSAGVISARNKWIKGNKNYSREFSQGQRIYDSKGISQTLAGNAGGQGGKTGLYAINPRNFKGKSYVKGDRAIGLSQPSGNNQTLVGDNARIRRLTPTECERLQSFPDGWTEGVSDTQRYKALGNAVTVNVIKAIMEKLL